MFTPEELAALRARIRAAVDGQDLRSLGGLIGVLPKDVAANRDKITMVLHKHRLEMRDKTRAERQESLDWLRARGFKRLEDKPLPATLDDMG